MLQRTFNLNIGVAATDGGNDGQEIEFSMLDQADFGGIDEYVKKHGLNDASMAAARKAKRLNINGPPKAKIEEGAPANGESTAMDEDGEEESELQKAERQLQDEEDDEEEDYDPGSEGESDGSGSEDEDDEGEDYDGEEGEPYDENEEDLENPEGDESEL